MEQDCWFWLFYPLRLFWDTVIGGENFPENRSWWDDEGNA
jgi:hypothetical protein